MTSTNVRVKTASPVVAVLNMKGGVGKTTVSANVFRVLFERHNVSTLLLDLDPQFNLTQALFTRSDYETWKEGGKTIFAAMEPVSATGLFEVATSPAAPPAAESISRVLWSYRGDSSKTLSIIPGDFRLVKYSLMTENRKLDAVQQRFLNFINSAKQRFSVICIDCNPSSSFITLCALHACSHILVPVRPDRYSILGLEMLADFVDSIPTIHPKPSISVILNGVPRRSYDDSIESELRAHKVFGTRTFSSVIYSSDILVAKADYTGFATDKRVPHSRTLTTRMNAVADELAAAIGIG